MAVYNQRSKKIKLLNRKSFRPMADSEIKKDQDNYFDMIKKNMVRDWVGENLIWRKKTFKELWRERLIRLLTWILFPFLYAYEFLDKIFYAFFYPRTNARFNGIIGPGGHTSYERNFSWGKLSFILIVLFILVYFVFLR